MRSSVRLLLLLILISARTPADAFQPRAMNAAELRLALDKLSVLGSVLYIGAHPDDENTNLLAYFGKDRLLRTAYLALTRGEGGQNLIGPEKGSVLGVIRTQELLAARAVDGAEQFFTRAIDFGYSKSSSEAIGFWGEEEILSDIVRVIRMFRPDVVITRFSPEIGGHGHHTASAILARRAFELAGDPDFHIGGPAGLTPWRAKRLLFNGSSWMLRQFDTTETIRLDIGGYNPLLGKSYNEIAGIGRSMHKSQGFGAAQSRGEVRNYFHHTAGDSAHSDIFEGIGMTWSRIPGGEEVGRLLEQARDSFDPENPSGIIPLLLRALTQMETLKEHHWTEVKKREIIGIIQAAAGLWIEALTDDYSATAGDTVSVRATIINRSASEFTLRRLSVPFAGLDSTIGEELPNNRQRVYTLRAVIDRNEPPTIPYWLRNPSDGFRYDVPDAADIGLPQSSSRYTVRFTLSSGVTDFDVVAPLSYAWVDPVEGQRHRAFIVTPPVLVHSAEKVLLFPSGREKSVSIALTAGENSVSGSVRLEVPPGWNVSPENSSFTLTGKGNTRFVDFSVAPSQGARSGSFTVIADVGGVSWKYRQEEVRYPHIPHQTVFLGATGKLLSAPVVKKKFHLGYIAGSGDDVPDALRQVGYDVRLLSDDDLATANLDQFQSIVAGVRAYNTRPALAAAHGRLMEYVRNGGTYVVQYVTRGNMETDDIAPYPLRISRDRVSDEKAAVTLLAPHHPALTYPNIITEEDFLGWVQERGLYFADRWDSSYTAIVSSNDPGEPPRSGGLLVARYGEGYYCYTGLSFFRQLPAGVTGAYRLFVNLIELGSFEKLEGKNESR